VVLRDSAARRQVGQGGEAILIRLAATLIGLSALFSAPLAMAEEGMWTFDAVPLQRVHETVGVQLSPVWLDHLRGATVRLTSGCSAAVVSRWGLSVTNAHCVLACLQTFQHGDRGPVEDGFLTETPPEERRCPGLAADILVAVVDATDFIYSASAGKFGDAFVASRQRAIAEAEKRVCDGGPSTRCQVVSFFDGGQFKVYKYRRYDDVRLVFAPEYAAAFFGGDADNFSFPRFALDCAFLRLYDNGHPAETPMRLAWSIAPPSDGEPVFIAGNPGFTERSATVADLTGERDIDLPAVLSEQEELRARLKAFAAAAPDNGALVADRLFEQDNLIKVYKGRLAALQDPALIAARNAGEATLRSRAIANPKLAAAIGDPWSEIAVAQAHRGADFGLYHTLEGGAGGGSQLFAWARVLVRGALERERPQGGWLSEYAPSRRVLLRENLLHPVPVSTNLEALYLSAWLSNAESLLPAGSPALIELLGGEAPQIRADGLASRSLLADPDVRQMLWDKGLPAIEASRDPMIMLALAIDPAARAARTAWENDVEGPIQRAGERIARARFVMDGQMVYPDATFSPRFSWGRVAGWEVDGRMIGPFTTFGGLLRRADGNAPRALSPRWVAASASLNPATVFNFTSTNDIAGGNSGSPVVNAHGDLLGIAFDGNAASIAGDFVYDSQRNRAIMLSAVAISEALGKVYGRARLLKELGGR
jgi:hypothetical protein